MHEKCLQSAIVKRFKSKRIFFHHHPSDREIYLIVIVAFIDCKYCRRPK